MVYVNLRNDEAFAVRGRSNGHERQDQIVLVHEAGRGTPRDDFTEDARHRAKGLARLRLAGALGNMHWSGKWKAHENMSAVRIPSACIQPPRDGIVWSDLDVEG